MLFVSIIFHPTPPHFFLSFPLSLSPRSFSFLWQSLIFLPLLPRLSSLSPSSLSYPSVASLFSPHRSTDLGEVLLSHLHLLLHQPPPVGRLVLKPPLGLLSPPPLLLQHLPPSLHLPLLGASGQKRAQRADRGGETIRARREYMLMAGKYCDTKQTTVRGCTWEFKSQSRVL